MDTESEPYIRLATLRKLHRAIADLNSARSLADTLQSVADGAVSGLGYELSAVNLVRPDGDLVVAAVSGSDGAEAALAGRVGSRASWERRLAMGDAWGDLRFIPHTEGWVLDDDDVPQWHEDGPLPRGLDEWHPQDRLFAPMYTSGTSASSASSGTELIGVLSVDQPRNGRRPGAWGREALHMYTFHAAVAIGNARLRANMQRALVRLERDRTNLLASEESFRQAFEYAPSGMAIAEMGGDQHGRLIRANDALCRLLGRPASALRQCSFADLVHTDDVGTLLRTSAEGGRAELRLARRDGSHLWVSLRNSVVADAADGPRFLLTHVEDIEERKRHELQLAHRASHDSLTGLPNSAELRSRLSSRLCDRPPQRYLGDEYGAPAPAGAPPAAGWPGAMAPEGFEDAADLVRSAHPEDVRELGVVPGLSGFPGVEEFDAAMGLLGMGGYDPFENAADHDPFADLEGIPGVPPIDRHAHTVAPAEGDGSKGLAVLFCDLDGFKSINDRFGHHTGDAVLIEVARRLTEGVRDGDTVARLGGDEFVVLADGLGTADADDLAVRLRNGILPPIRVDGRAVRVGASFGIGWAACGMSAEEVLQSADQRMYVEKRSRSKASRRAG